MIVLDTNVVSEPLRRSPDPGVIEWLDRQPAESLFLTATSLSELLTVRTVHVDWPAPLPDSHLGDVEFEVTRAVWQRA